MGLRPPERRDSVAESGDDGGEWVTVVSKFHFVDLAGSERVSVSPVVRFPQILTRYFFF